LAIGYWLLAASFRRADTCPKAKYLLKVSARETVEFVVTFSLLLPGGAGSESIGPVRPTNHCRDSPGLEFDEWGDAVVAEEW
jgi:hypothetical protein